MDEKRAEFKEAMRIKPAYSTTEFSKQCWGYPHSPDEASNPGVTVIQEGQPQQPQLPETDADHEEQRTNTREVFPLLALWAFAVVFSLLYSFFVYKSMLSHDPKIGDQLPLASTTNLVVSVLSQVLANMIDMLVTGSFDMLRWQLAARKIGVSATTFLQLSSSTQWISVLFLTVTKMSSSFVGSVRLLMPLLGLYFGSLLKYKAEFVYFFSETASRTPVFAGSGIPVDETLLAIVPGSYIGLFFMSWIPTLLDVPKYAVPMPIDSCKENCTSVFLPGGIETARIAGPYLNRTLLEGGALRNAETIQIHNAPGVLLTYQTLGPEFKFDFVTECALYGQQLDDILQICIKAINGSLAVGWAACPTSIYTAKACTTNTTWLYNPLTKQVLMTRYKRYATVSYNGNDFTIVNVEPTSPLHPEPLNVTTYLAAFQKLFIPPPPFTADISTSNTATPIEAHIVNALTYGITWLIRLYDDMFPDDMQTPLSHLRNFLAIPHQFMVTCLQYANYSVTPELARVLGKEGRFSLPSDMQTFASRGVSTTRFLGVRWVVWVYIASVAGVLVVIGAMIVGMALREDGIPASTGFVEVDLAARFQGRGDDGRLGGFEDGLDGLRELKSAKAVKLAAPTSFNVARELKRRRIRVMPVAGQGGKARSGVFTFREATGMTREQRTRRSMLPRSNTDSTKMSSPIKSTLRW